MKDAIISGILFWAAMGLILISLPGCSGDAQEPIDVTHKTTVIAGTFMSGNIYVTEYNGKCIYHKSSGIFVGDCY